MARLTFRKRLTWGAHLFKALTRQHHEALLPLLDTHVPKDGVIIDVGAHAGQFTKLFARAVPQGHVYSFEPGSYARSIVSKVIALKKLKNVSLFPLGLGDTPSEQTLRVPVKASGSVGFGLSHISSSATGPISTDPGRAGGGTCPVMGGRKADEEKIAITTLDQFIFQRNIPRVNFIKADIEGWEMRFLLGAHHVIEKFRPVLFLEINDEYLKRAGNTAAEMWNFITALGYRIERIEGDGRRLTPLSAPIMSGDIWCVPDKANS